MAEAIDLTLFDGISNIPEVESIEQMSNQIEVETPETEESTEQLRFEDLPVEEETVKETKTNTEQEQSDNRLYADYLVKAGRLEPFKEEEFEDSSDWIDTKLDETYTKRAEEKLEEILDPTIAEINNLYKQGVPLSELIQIKAEQLEVEKITDEQLKESEEVQERIVSKLLTYQGFSPSEIKEEIDMYKDANILEKKALSAKTKIKQEGDKQIEVQKQYALEQDRRANEEANMRLSVLKTTIQKTDEFIKGVPIKEAEKAKFFEGLTKPGKDGMTEFQRKLMNPELQMKVAQFLLLMNGDLSNVETDLKTKASKQIKQTISGSKPVEVDTKTEAKKALENIKSMHKRKLFN